MKQLVLIILLLWGNFQLILSQGSSARPLMLYGDTSRVGVPYSKDPHVVNFKGRYLMYHSIPPMKGEPDSCLLYPSAMPYRMTAFISEGIRRIRFSIRPEIGLVGVP